MKIKEFCRMLVVRTEDFLTWYKARQEAKKEKQKKKNQLLDWLEAFLWAAGVVLLVNQYLVQAYRIPSGSMIDTLMIKDMIFVNKIVYGPELIPGYIKLHGFEEPKRGEVMIFESPEYDSRGPVFDVAQRIIYMLTLSLIDIDGKDEYGRPKVHFLIKRLMAIDGDTVKFENGDLSIKPRGTVAWQDEKDFKEQSHAVYNNNRLIGPDFYQTAYRYIMEMKFLGNLSPETLEAVKVLDARQIQDQLYFKKTGALAEGMVNPHSVENRSLYWSLEQGQYIPVGWILPLGDNRDNSNDGRYFGPVPKSKVLGRAMFIYWPLFRAGKIK